MNDNNISISPPKLMNNIREISYSLRVIAGLSYCLNKCYKVSPILINGEEDVYYLFRTDFQIDKKDLKKKIKNEKNSIRAFNVNVKEHNDRIAYLNSVPSEYAVRSKNNADYIIKYITQLESLGIDVSEKRITRTAQLPVIMTYVSHDITGRVPLITPDYFLKFFNETYIKYLRIKELRATSIFADEMSKYVHYLNRSFVKGVTLGLELCSTGCQLKQIRALSIEGDGSYSWYSQPAGFLDFHRFEMSNIDNTDINTFSALAIALIEKVINNTKKNGRQVLDLSTDYSFQYLDEDGFDNRNLRVPLKYIIESEKTYTQW